MIYSLVGQSYLPIERNLIIHTRTSEEIRILVPEIPKGEIENFFMILQHYCDQHEITFSNQT